MNYWLMKSEPCTYSIEDLKREKVAGWDGVRNYQARNFMRDEMRVGDGILYYHSNCKVPGIVGLATVASKPYPDPTQFDPDSEYYDPKSTQDAPRWMLVDIKFRQQFSQTLALANLKQVKKLSNMRILQRGNRLSITPVSKLEWETILQLERSLA